MLLEWKGGTLVPKTICAVPYGGGDPAYDEIVRRRPRLDVIIPVLRDSAAYLDRVPTRETEVYEMVGSLCLKWPWVKGNIDEVGRLIESTHLPEWAIPVVRQVIADIKSGELTNSWVNPFAQDTPAA